MKILGKILLIFSTVVFAVSCRNVIVITPPLGDSTRNEDQSGFEDTFGSIDWSAIIADSIEKSGLGWKNGKLSIFSEDGTSSTRAIEDSEFAGTLCIAFSGFTDESSGVEISKGDITFTLSGTRNAVSDVYAIDSYSAVTGEDLSMTSSSGTVSTVSISKLSGTASATITKSSGKFIASNVSINPSAGSGIVIVNENRYTMDSITNDMNPGTAAGSGTEAKPYIIRAVSDIEEMISILSRSRETIYFELGDDIELPIPEDSASSSLLEIPEHSSAVLNLNNHSIMPSGDLMNTRYYLIDVRGDLVVNGTGTIGGDYKSNGISRAFHALPGAYLELNSGVSVKTFSETYGSSVYVEGEAFINGAVINGTYYALGIASTGSVVIDGGSILTSMASNALTYDQLNKDGYAYTISSSGHIEINDAEIYGIQGGISIIGGSGILNDGVYSETTIDVFNKLPKEFRTFYDDHHRTDITNKEPQQGECHYGLYVAGEASRDDEPSCAINGGTYISQDKAAVYVGNSNDGGEGATAFAVIYDGYFICPDKASSCVYMDILNPEYGLGDLTIRGGYFTKDANLEHYCDEGFIVSTDKITVDGKEYFHVIPE